MATTATKTTTTTKAPAPAPVTNLKVGSTGSQVVALQKSLGIKADGIFGPQTQAAVVNFQKQNGLAVDGIAGKQTQGALGTISSGGSTTTTTSKTGGATTASGGGSVNDIPVPVYGAEVKDASGKVIGTAKFNPRTGLPLDPNAKVGDVMGTINDPNAPIKKVLAMPQYDLSYDKGLDKAIGYYGDEAGQEINESKTRDDVLRQFQAEIDATNAIYNSKLNEAKVQGKSRLGSETAVQGRRGLLGSDFGETRYESKIALNNEAEDLVHQEKAAKISNIMSRANAAAASAIAAKRAAKEAGTESYVKYLKERGTQKQVNAVAAATAILSQGLTIETLDPVSLKMLADGYGVSVDSIKAAYSDVQKAEKAKQAAAEKDNQVVLAAGQTLVDRDGNVIAHGENKPIELSEGEAIVSADGKVLYKNNKTYAPKSGGGSSSGGSGGGSVSPTGTGNVSSDLNFLYQQTRTGKNSATVGLLDSAWKSARNDRDRINLLAQNVALPATVKSDLIQRSTAIPMIDSAIALLDKGVQTGFFKNLGEKAANKFGTTTDPEINQIKQYITSAIQPYRSSITGAAWGPQEEAEYSALFGSTLDNPAFLKSKLESMKKLMLQSNIATISSGISLADPSMAAQYLGGAPSTTPSTTTTAPAATVKMMGPNGQVGYVSQSKVQSAQNQGWRVVN